jgi:hypothetical protein
MVESSKPHRTPAPPLARFSITNEMARALNLLAKQSIKMCNAIYQNHLALDYLLASERRVCGKFNLSNCCLQIDDKGKFIKKITE